MFINLRTGRKVIFKTILHKVKGVKNGKGIRRISQRVGGFRLMVTTRSEALHMVAILMRYISKKESLKMLKDMNEEVANKTDNKSLRDSIKLVLNYLK